MPTAKYLVEFQNVYDTDHCIRFSTVCWRKHFFALLLSNDVLNNLLCSAGILIKIFERFIENCRYICISRQIDGSQQTVEVHPTKEGIEKLQSLIDARRSINVLELGWFHNKLANKLSKLYKKIVS